MEKERIALNECESQLQSLNTLIHEIAHAKLHSTWIQLQHMILGHTYRSASGLYEDVRVNYWWENGKEKPAGVSPDLVMADILLIASKLDEENIGELHDPDLLVNIIKQYISVLNFHDKNGLIISDVLSLTTPRSVIV